MEKVRIQLTLIELKILRNLLAVEYHRDRSNLRYQRKRIARGEADSPFYPLSMREKNLKELGKLLRKLHKHTGFEQRWDTR